MRTKTTAIALLLAATAMSGCASLEPNVDFPPDTSLADRDIAGIEKGRRWEEEKKRQDELYEKAKIHQAENRTPGSIYSKSNFRSVYQDMKPRFPGDIVVVQIVESINAAQSKSTGVSRDDGFDFDVGLPGTTRSGSVSASKDFSGDGSTKASNLFRGTIAATVIETLENGNLRIVGEKQIGTNRQVETLRFYGVVSPRSITQPGNRVKSTEVADARLEYKGEGSIDTAQMMGWLSRIVFSIAPF